MYTYTCANISVAKIICNTHNYARYFIYLYLDTSIKNTPFSILFNGVNVGGFQAP